MIKTFLKNSFIDTKNTLYSVFLISLPLIITNIFLSVYDILLTADDISMFITISFFVLFFIYVLLLILNFYSLTKFVVDYKLNKNTQIQNIKYYFVYSIKNLFRLIWANIIIYFHIMISPLAYSALFLCIGYILNVYLFKDNIILSGIYIGISLIFIFYITLKNFFKYSLAFYSIFDNDYISTKKALNISKSIYDNFKKEYIKNIIILCIIFCIIYLTISLVLTSLIIGLNSLISEYSIITTNYVYILYIIFMQAVGLFLGINIYTYYKNKLNNISNNTNVIE